MYLSTDVQGQKSFQKDFDGAHKALIWKLGFDYRDFIKINSSPNSPQKTPKSVTPMAEQTQDTSQVDR